MSKIEKHGKPTIKTVGRKGDIYIDLDTGNEYVCHGTSGFVDVDCVDEPVEYKWMIVDADEQTHYDTRTIEEFSYEWDGSLDDRETVTTEYCQFVKVSNKTIPVTSEETIFKSLHAELYDPDTHEYLQDSNCTDFQFSEGVPGKLYIYNPEDWYAFIVIEDVDYVGAHFTKGVYFNVDAYGRRVGKLDVVLESGAVKKLDMKYMPDDMMRMLTEPYIVQIDRRYNGERYINCSYDDILQAFNESRKIQALYVGQNTSSEVLYPYIHLTDHNSVGNYNSPRLPYFRFAYVDTSDNTIKVFMIKKGAKKGDAIEYTSYSLTPSN